MLNQVLPVIGLAVWSVFGLGVLLYLVAVLRARGLGGVLGALFSARLVGLTVLLLALTFLGTSLVFVEPDRVGVVISIFAPRGYRDQPLPSGLHWIVPLAERVQTYPIYWQTYTMSSNPLEGDQLGDDSIAARTSDGQQVTLDCSIIFRIDAEQAVRVHIDWQDRYVQDLVRPQVRGIVRTEVSQFTVDEINSSKRRDLENTLDKRVRATLEDKGLALDKFVLRNIGFSPEYAASVEQKQMALQGKFQKEYEAEQVLIKARADTQALQLIADALNKNPNLITYEYVQKLAPDIKVMLVPNNAPYLLPLPDLNATTPISSASIITPTPAVSTPVPTALITPTPTPTPVKY